MDMHDPDSHHHPDLDHTGPRHRHGYGHQHGVIDPAITETLLIQVYWLLQAYATLGFRRKGYGA
jgi:hypothetical protein